MGSERMTRAALVGWGLALLMAAGPRASAVEGAGAAGPAAPVTTADVAAVAVGPAMRAAAAEKQSSAGAGLCPRSENSIHPA